MLKKIEKEQFNNSRANYSPEQRDAITKQIQERLYKPAVKKLLDKGNIKENQYSRKKIYKNEFNDNQNSINAISTTDRNDLISGPTQGINQNYNIKQVKQPKKGSGGKQVEMKYNFIDDLNSDG